MVLCTLCETNTPELGAKALVNLAQCLKLGVGKNFKMFFQRNLLGSQRLHLFN